MEVYIMGKIVSYGLGVLTIAVGVASIIHTKRNMIGYEDAVMHIKSELEESYDLGYADGYNVAIEEINEEEE